LVGDNPELLDEMRVFPNGQHDDCISEGTLILTKKGQVLIKNVCVGDYVMTRNGYQKVVKVWDKGFKKVIKKLGIIATPDHKIITKEGVIPLCNVKLSDILYIWNEKLSCIEEKDIIDTRNQNLDNTEYIMCDTTNGKKHQFIYTDRFGLITLGRYLKDFIYTIKIITLSIIKLITWNSSQLQTTPLNIQTDQKEKKWQGKMLLKIIRKCKKLLNFGDIAWKVENGIHFIREQVLINQNELFVQSVEQKQLNTEQMENIALKNVAINSNSEIIVQDIQIIGRRKVYDLMVENNHEFFANGILVHNCVDAMSMQLQQARPPFRKPMYPEERKAEVNISI
jgi:intein/homing endonuclease